MSSHHRVSTHCLAVSSRNYTKSVVGHVKRNLMFMSLTVLRTFIVTLLDCAWALSDTTALTQFALHRRVAKHRENLFSKCPETTFRTRKRRRDWPSLCLLAAKSDLLKAKVFQSVLRSSRCLAFCFQHQVSAQQSRSGSMLVQQLQGLCHAAATSAAVIPSRPTM